MRLAPLCCRLVASLMLLASACGAAQAEGKDPPRHRAILIGVKAYRPAGFDQDKTPQLRMLRNLNTPCDDVEKLSLKLQQAGWTFDNEDPKADIHAYCDRDIGAVEQEIRSAIYEMDKPDDLLVIYLAGHGAEIGGRNYFFGPMAKLDMPFAIERLTKWSKNLLFVGQALDLDGTVMQPAGLFYNGNVLVILDACRDDGVTYGAMAKSLGLKVGAPFNANQSSGVRILYATTPGLRISDGVGLSYLSRALSEQSLAGSRVYEIILKARQHVMSATSSESPVQSPVPLGDFNNIDLCFSGCAPAANAALTEGKSASAPRRIQAKSFSGRPQLIRIQNLVPAPEPETPAPPPPAPVNQFRVVRERPSTDRIVELKATPISVDVYWCQGRNEDARHEQAEKFTEQLAALGDNYGIAGAGTMLGEVRIRALSPSENERAGFRLSADAVRVDYDAPVEAAMLAPLREISHTPLERQGVRAGSRDQVSVFLCKGVDKLPPIDRLYLQVASDDQKGLAAFLGQEIRSRADNLSVAAVDARPETQAIAPEQTQIRYFFEDDRGTAELAAGVLQDQLAARPQLRPMLALGEKDPALRGLIELWVGRSVEPRRSGANLRF